MKRAFTANIGGVVFHIDEDAYQKLNRYLDLLKGHFRKMEGDTEIIDDIEARIAEMFQGRLKNREVVTLGDVDEVIKQMGTPEEFEATPGEDSEDHHSRYDFQDNRRFFRNPDDKVLGGVCSGLSAYFNIDPLWLRLAFAISIFFAGTGILIYILLWIILPEAKTPAEKLQMRGEKVTVSNLEKTLKNEFHRLKDEFQEYASGQKADRFRNRAGEVANDFGNVLAQVITVMVKVAGIILIILGGIILVSLGLALLGITTAFSFSFPMISHYFLENNTQEAIAIVGLVFLVAVPIFWLIVRIFLSLLKIRTRKRYINAGFFVLWIVGWIFITIVGFQLATDFRIESRHIERDIIPAASLPDTLYLSMQRDDFNERTEDEGTIHFDELSIHDGVLKVKTMDIRIENHDKDEVEIVRIFSARGSNKAEAKQRAQAIRYDFEHTGNEIRFPGSLAFEGEVWRVQEVDVIIRVPRTKKLILDDQMAAYSDNYTEWAPAPVPQQRRDTTNGMADTLPVL